MKKFGIGCLSIIGIIVVIGIIIGVASGGGDDTSSTSGSDSSNNSEKKASNEEETFSLGDTAEVGAVTYTVDNFETTQSVGPSVLPTETDQQFIVLDVTFKNNGNEAVTFDSSYLKLKNGDKTYEASSEASMSANQSEDGSIDNSFFLQEVNPDSEISGKVVFEVAPEVAEADGLQLQVQEGIFGTKTGLYNLK
ncbi:DUF4352 domain-containing protein [Terribacillus saccharophilus]|uniref:DUF4352 domain-containing protein n=1 Tax=Terribacillus saccharophilus TaxID=361277 RepID=UPI003981ADEC